MTLRQNFEGKQAHHQMADRDEFDIGHTAPPKSRAKKSAGVELTAASPARDQLRTSALVVPVIWVLNRQKEQLTDQFPVPFYNKEKTNQSQKRFVLI